VREISQGNKYTVCQMWEDHVAYAGVIQRRRYNRRSRVLTLHSAELRAAYLNARMLYGVGADTSPGVVLAVSGKSHSGAARAVLSTAMPNFDWELPIDLPSDGSGGFSASWEYDERLMVEDHLDQIEKDGCEIDFRPYLDGSGYLRWEARVATQITSGTATAVEDLVVDVDVETDYSRQVTGVLGLGKDGAQEIAEYPPGGTPFSVRDVWVNFGDIDGGRLQNAVDATFAERIAETDQWSFPLRVHPGGPEFAAPGRLLNLTIAGDEFIPDGTHEKRVIGLRGDMGFTVVPEVQDA
jgi:hypothetical protein